MKLMYKSVRTLTGGQLHAPGTGGTLLPVCCTRFASPELGRTMRLSFLTVRSIHAPSVEGRSMVSKTGISPADACHRCSPRP